MLRLLILASVVVACSSRPQLVSAPPRGADTRTEIETLDNQIADQLVRLEIQPFTATCAADKSCTADPPAAPTCANTTPSCDDTCSLGEAICKNAARICEIATQLGGLDTYANEKCAHGKESCTAARERCCNCKP